MKREYEELPNELVWDGEHLHEVALTVMADGAAMTDIITTLGIRAADTNADGTPMFVVLPVRGDRITILDKALADSDFWVADRKPDGQGGHVLQLRREVLP